MLAWIQCLDEPVIRHAVVTRYTYTHAHTHTLTDIHAKTFAYVQYKGEKKEDVLLEQISIMEGKKTGAWRCKVNSVRDDVAVVCSLAWKDDK